MRRYLETFFRYPWLYVLPLVVALIGSELVAERALRNRLPYAAEAVIAVNLDPSRERNVGTQPPGQQYAELLAELMATEGFVSTALQQTSLASADSTLDESVLERIQANWREAAAGPNTVRMTYRCQDSGICLEVLSAVLTTFRDQISTARLADKTATREFYQKQLQAVEERLRTLPPDDPAHDIARQSYDTLYSRALDASVEESLEAQAAQSAFQILSPPRVSAVSRGPLDRVLPLALGATVGLALGLAAVALVTWLDPVIHTSNDLFVQLGLRPVALVPPRSRLK